MFVYDKTNIAFLFFTDSFLLVSQNSCVTIQTAPVSSFKQTGTGLVTIAFLKKLCSGKLISLENQGTSFLIRGYQNMGSNALDQLKQETKDDVRLFNCIKELYEQGVPFAELKALIPDIRRTRDQLHMKRMLENNNAVLLSMFTKEMSFLLDAKERRQEEEFKKLDQLIRQQQSFRKSAAEAGPVEKLKRLFLPA